MKWCIKITEENLPVVGKWFNQNSQHRAKIDYTDFFKYQSTGYLHYPITVDAKHYGLDIEDGYTELTFEQFKEQILKEQNVLNEILDKIRAKVYYNNFDEKVVELDDIEEIFSNYLNK